MKALGIGAAGVGAASATVPVFHDIDEIASIAVKPKHPWWVKERDYMKPTTEIDWAMMERFAGASWDNQRQHVTPEHNLEIRNTTSEKLLQRTLDNKPGDQLRDRAMRHGHRPFFYNRTVESAFIGEPFSGTYDRLGVPKWTGTLEENARTIRNAALCQGAAEVTFGELTPGTTQKLIHTTCRDFGPKMRLEFEDTPKPYVEDDGTKKGKAVIPNNMKYVIVLTLLQPLWGVRHMPAQIGFPPTHRAYQMIDIVQWRMKSFLKGIGYNGVGGLTFGITGRPAWGVIFGHGELARNHMLMTPRWGECIRTSMIIPTDIPLPPDNPIDFGSNRFCYDCMKCRNICPTNAIYGEREPDFISTDPNSQSPKYDTDIPPDNLKPELFNNSPGYKRWPLNHYACSTQCAQCFGACVFNKDVESSIHELVKPVISNTSILNGFFANMDEMFGYGQIPEDKWHEWWENDPPKEDMRYG
jgi:reductive dehalogenase